MRVITDAEPLGAPPPPVSLAIGVFDGVHIGHAAVVRRMLADARTTAAVPVVVTFDRHPYATLAPDRTPPMIYPLWRRLDALAELGAELALVFRFDLAFSRQSAESFLERLLTGFGRVTSIAVGAGFVFGHRRGGNVALLRNFGQARGFIVEAVEPVQWKSEPVSSTRVRESIAEADFSTTAGLLGRPYALAGEVRHGDHLGHQFGFPTANLDVDGLVLPPAGVYAAIARWSGKVRPAAVNIGTRPTLNPASAAIRVEAHLLGIDTDLYGQRLELEFHHCLRPEVRFSSLDELIAQIQRDIAEVTAWAGNKGLL
jgi:riboflavin kinase/FMN adenylyltransferase